MSTQPENQGITRIAVSGFKSLRDESHIEVRPLTVLAGANSSGKSSIMQPLLLLKQTLEAPYDPGPLLLNGYHIEFTSAEQFLSLGGERKDFTVGFGLDGERWLTSIFRKTAQAESIELVETSSQFGTKKGRLWLGMTNDELREQVEDNLGINALLGPNAQWQLTRNRCFLAFQEMGSRVTSYPPPEGIIYAKHIEHLLSLIHLSGFRVNPGRAYRFTPVTSGPLQGVFENYFASIIYHWQQTLDPLLDQLNHYLADQEKLRLTSKVSAKPISEVQIELRVGRTLHSDSNDTVNITDVGSAISQVLPVLVALLVAEPGQLVYLEQPELHLHPRAQHALAQALADAANRGVRVVVETHSDLLLLGIQTLVAEGKLAPEKVICHWFERGEDGVTKITRAELDEKGAYGNWPEDFAHVDFQADARYLDAIEKQRVHIQE